MEFGFSNTSVLLKDLHFNGLMDNLMDSYVDNK